MKTRLLKTLFIVNLLIIGSCFFGCSKKGKVTYDLIIRGGTIYDGSGAAAIKANIAVNADTICIIGPLEKVCAQKEIDAQGLAVAPGFINMLSWACASLIEDGCSQGNIRQGVTLEVMGEGWSMGPLNDEMKKRIKESQSKIKYDIEWTTLGEYLDYLISRGISTNVASFIGASTVRAHEIGYDNRPPKPGELEQMRSLVRQAMEEGALGVASALIYAPGCYAKTDELTELCKAAAEYGGMYISHIRSEGNDIIDALDELITIAREANVRAEIYHLKAAGKPNWPKMDEVIRKVEQARDSGLHITANMYTYTAAATGLDAVMPPWVREGGFEQWKQRLQDPKIRVRLAKEITTPSDKWENFYLLAGSPERILFIGFKNDSLKPLTGKTLAEVAHMRGKSPVETAMDLIIEDNSKVGTIYFLMSEENIVKQIKLPWVSFCSDAESMAPEGNFIKKSCHPRAYGNFSRLLGKYVREEKVIPLEEAIRKLTSLPAENMRIQRRGKLLPGYYADIVIFDQDSITDHATFTEPHQFSTGVKHLFVNGVQVLHDGEHTGAKPGQVVRGPGWRGAL